MTHRDLLYLFDWDKNTMVRKKIDKLFLFRKEAALPSEGFHSSPLLWLDRDLETLFVLQREEKQRTQRKIV